MNRSVRAILVSLLIVLFVILLWYIRTVISYVLISAVLSIVGRPIMRFIEGRKVLRWKVPSSVAAGLTLVGMLMVFVGLFSMFVPLVVDEATYISEIDPERVKEAWAEPISDIQTWLTNNDLISEDKSEQELVDETVNRAFEVISFTDIFSELLNQLGNILIGLFSILFITFFFLKDRRLLYDLIYALAPDEQVHRLQKVLQQARHTLQRYVLGVLLQITMITVIVSIGLSIVGIKNALLIGFLAGIINIIPYLGPLIGGTVGLIIGITSHLELDFYSEMVPLMLKIVAVFSAAQLLDNFIFQPFIFSSSVKAHPLEIFIVILAAGTLAGIPGMILAVPVYSFARIFAAEFFSEFRMVKKFTQKVGSEGDQ